ncbi:MAG: hypothetical protein K9M51_04135 [Candidatus Gracilibacteria bacterium]|nr:hypothetical protein [Candidatus Gracilibacteria bacterium]
MKSFTAACRFVPYRHLVEDAALAALLLAGGVWIGVRLHEVFGSLSANVFLDASGGMLV